jgi:hypothetical protein
VFILEPVTIGFAQGYFPDATLSKPLELSKFGKIRVREDWVYIIENGKMSPKGFKVGYDKFDSLGRKIEEANYDFKGAATLEVTYSYDEWGREIQCLGLKERSNYYRKWEYEFIDSSKCLEKRIYNNPRSKERWLYKFDSKGNIIEETNYTASGDFNYKYAIKYTASNKPAQLIEYSGNGAVYEKWVYFYNKQNQNIEVMQFNSNGELYKKYLNKFDERGNMKEVYTLDKDEKELQRTVCIYHYF